MNTSRPKVILFDLDGTLVDTAPDVHPAINAALEEMGLPLLTFERARLAIGPGADSFVNIILGQVNENRLEEFLLHFRPLYYERCTDKSRPFPGIVDLLTTLQPDFRLGVATNKGRRTTTRVLDVLALAPFFELVVCPDSVERGKPAPDMLLLAMDHFQVEPQQMLFIGDTDNDILAAKAAGVPCIAVTWGYADHAIIKALNPDFIVDAPAEVLKLLGHTADVTRHSFAGAPSL